MASYQVLLYNSQNATQTLVADITPLVDNLRYSVPLNNFEEIDFDMDLWHWLRYCEQSGLDPYWTLRPYTAEIKLKRNGVFLPFVCEIKQSPKSYTADRALITVRARGTLSKLGDALITASYDGIDATAITRDLIALRQAKPYGDFGITNGNTWLTGVPTNRTYERYPVMDAIRNLSDDTSGRFDFFFDHDWAYYTMSERGSLKADITYAFGSANGNVIDYQNPEDGTVLSNSLITVGQGIGDPLLSDEAVDEYSAITYGLREKALQFSSIDNMDWLNTRAEAELEDRKDIYDLPNFTVSGDIFDLGDKFTGDTVPISCTDPASPYVGYGRIKRLEVSVDKNHHEIISVECFKT